MTLNVKEIGGFCVTIQNPSLSGSQHLEDRGLWVVGAAPEEAPSLWPSLYLFREFAGGHRVTSSCYPTHGETESREIMVRFGGGVTRRSMGRVGPGPLTPDCFDSLYKVTQAVLMQAYSAL